jgi:hypothetical protein
MTRLPASPFADHAFLPLPASGDLYDETGQSAWIVVLQRDGTIRGPRPALTYVPVRRGLPHDVVAYHLMDAAAFASNTDTDVLSTRPSRSSRKVATLLLGIGIGVLLAVLAGPSMDLLEDDL